MNNEKSALIPSMYRLSMLLLGNSKSAVELTGQVLRETDVSEHMKIDASAAILRAYTVHADPSETDLSADSPLLALLRLPDSQRRLCALRLCGFSDVECSDILDTTLANLSPRLEKAMRKLTVSQNGDAPPADILQAAADALLPTAEQSAAVTEIIEQGKTDAPVRKIEMRKSGKVHSVAHNVEDDAVITHSEPPPDKKTIRLPLWELVLLLLICLLLLAAVLLLLLKNDANANHSSGENSHPTQSLADVPRVDSPYLDFASVRTQTLDYADVAPESATFIKTKLCTDTNPVSYDVIFLDGSGTQYEYILNAEDGTLIDFQINETATRLDTSDFLPLDEIRAAALKCAGLEDAVFIKEKLDSDSDTYFFKEEFLDADGRSYSVEILAKTGAVIKYTVKETAEVNTEGFIAVDVAKQKALLRAGLDPLNAQVIFTKEKLDGNAYLLAFTLEDGTQYTVEIDAETGEVNTVDVIWLSADSSHFIGLSKAKEIALERAGIPDSPAVTFTKAKIERSNAAYAYELEFETVDYEYEIRIFAESGEVQKYRVWFQ